MGFSLLGRYVYERLRAAREVKEVKPISRDTCEAANLLKALPFLRRLIRINRREA